MKKLIWSLVAIAALAVLLWLAPWGYYVATYALFGPAGLFSTNPTTTAFAALAAVFVFGLLVLLCVDIFWKIWD